MLPQYLQSGFASVSAIVAVMVVIAIIEAVIPLRALEPWRRAHIAPNLALTFLTFATNIFLNAALIAGLLWLQSRNFGILRQVEWPFAAIAAATVLALDFSFYVAHIAMHKIPAFWRVHSVHHCDPAVDVTTTIRQHPLEGLIRYAFMAAAAFALGASLEAFAIYRLWSVIGGLFEHANIRLPRWLDRVLVLAVTTPDMHKIHHSRVAAQTDSNYGNVTSLFDRVFGTYTPSKNGTSIAYGLLGHDDMQTQSTLGLLALPFRSGLSVAVAEPES